MWEEVCNDMMTGKVGRIHIPQDLPDYGKKLWFLKKELQNFNQGSVIILPILLDSSDFCVEKRLDVNKLQTGRPKSIPAWEKSGLDYKTAMEVKRVVLLVQFKDGDCTVYY